MKRIYWILMTAVLIFLLMHACLYADGTQPAGSGTRDDPYQISDLDNLIWVSTNPSSWSLYFIQTMDIDASGTSEINQGAGFYPIGNGNVKFTGAYDGEYHYIRNLTIQRDSSDYIGPFGYIYNADIRNLGVTDVNIIAHNYAGGLAGCSNHSSIKNCYTTGTVMGCFSVGGLVGSNNNYSSVSTSYSACNSYIRECNDNNLPGIVGGLVGYNGHATVENSYSTGSVYGGNKWHAGGLVGYIDECTIEKSYSTGYVSGGGYVGGLTGGNYYSGQPFYKASTIENSFWDIGASGVLSSDGGTGKTTAEMKDIATYTDENTEGLDNAWDFVTNPNDDIANNDLWDMDASGTINEGYPFLSWQNGNEVSLAVELICFTAKYTCRGVELEWITASEINNIGFIVERCSQLKGKFMVISSYKNNNELKGMGNCAMGHKYRITDRNMGNEINYYYKLIQVESNGRKKYYGPIEATGRIKVEKKGLAKRIGLLPPYPNPFNSSAIINFALKKECVVDLRIYDISGRLMRTLVNENRMAGRYMIKWEGKDDMGNELGSGMYLIILRTGDFFDSRKLILIK